LEVTCPKCHSENSAESSYCAGCGTKLHPDEEEISAVPTKTLKSPIEDARKRLAGLKELP